MLVAFRIEGVNFGLIVLPVLYLITWQLTYIWFLAYIVFKVSEAEAAGSVERHESLLERLLEKLHVNHHLAMRTKSQLISLYGNTPGLEYQVKKEQETSVRVTQ